MYSLFVSNNKKHMPVCAKTVSSWVRKVLGVANACLPVPYEVVQHLQLLHLVFP